jgi:hypothetical protein
MHAARRDREEQVDEVLGGVLELGVRRDVVVAALAEARGFGPPVSFGPAVEGSQVHDAAVPGDGAAHGEAAVPDR